MLCNLHRDIDQPLRSQEAVSVLGVPDVEAERYLARDDVSRPWLHGELPDRGHQSFAAAGVALDRLHKYGGRGERILAAVHRSGAGMGSHTREREAVARLAGDCG